MMVFFTEEDLISFGTYMISKERIKAIEASGLEFEQIAELKKEVSSADLENWLFLTNQAKQERE